MHDLLPGPDVVAICPGQNDRIQDSTFFDITILCLLNDKRLLFKSNDHLSYQSYGECNVANCNGKN